MSELKTRPRRTVEDYLNLPEGVRAELIGGEILMSPSPKDRHQKIVGNIYFALRAFVEPRGLGEVRMAPDDVHLPTMDVVQPDVLFVTRQNLAILRDWIRGVPSLVIEVLSPEGADRDLFTKKELYTRNAVPEYWIVDGEARSVDVLAFKAGRYEPHGHFVDGDTITSLIVPGLQLPVRDLMK